MGIEWFRDLSITILGTCDLGCAHLYGNNGLPPVSPGKFHSAVSQSNS